MYVPPPPPPKPISRTSGRVTHSQSAEVSKPKVAKEAKAASHSFAPKNASFRPPEIKTMTNLPQLAPKTKWTKKHNITFEPILPTNEKETSKQTRSKAVKQAATQTKAVRKHSEIPIEGKVTKPVPKTSRVSITPPQCSSSSDLEQNTKFSPILKSKNMKSLPPQNSPRITEVKSESSSEQCLCSPKSLYDCASTPEQIVEEAKNISPCVTMSRGKDNVRKEKKLDEGLLDEDASNVDSVDHFRRQLASVIKRMTEMCEVWDKILEQTVLPESVQEAVLCAVGQARLLMSQKLQQFASLVEWCARPEPGTTLITPADLHGFRDMVFMQVDDVDMRFNKLEELRLCGWVEDQPVEIKKKVVRPTVNVKKAAKPAGGPSRLREMIAAARKAMREQEEAPTSTTTLQLPSGDSKTFEAGFFSIHSPVRSPASAPHSLASALNSPASAPYSPASALNSPASSHTPASKSSLLKAVLSSEAKKASASKNSTSFAMLRASVLGKHVEYDGFSLLPQTPVPMTPINLYTPGSSMLRSTNTEKKSTRKSFKMVLFNCPDCTDPPFI